MGGKKIKREIASDKGRGMVVKLVCGMSVRRGRKPPSRNENTGLSL